jgi:hypothetical protein
LRLWTDIVNKDVVLIGNTYTVQGVIGLHHIFWQKGGSFIVNMHSPVDERERRVLVKEYGSDIPSLVGPRRWVRT